LNPPLPRILALEQDVRHHAGDRQQDEQDRADHRHGQAQVGVNASARHGEDQIRDERLHPEVQGAAAKAAEGADEVHNPHVRLLEVAHEADAQAGDQSEPQGQAVLAQHRGVQVGMVLVQLQHLAVAHIDGDAHCKAQANRLEKLQH